MIALVSLALVHATLYPTVATCQRGYFANGVRPSGESTCREVPPAWVCSSRHGCADEWRGEEYVIRIRCREGQEPRVVTERRIQCR